MKILKFLFLSVFFVGLYSCSSSDNEGEGGSTVESITITASTETQIVGQPITFIVTTDTDEDVTATSTISAGNDILTDATLNSSAVGQKIVTANYGGKSATITVNFINEIPTSIILTANSTTQSTGDETVFTVETNTGINVTSTAVITVNGNSVNAGLFTSNTVGTFDAVATFDGLTSETVTIVYNQAITFTKRVLIEDYTGTWCGYCPRVAQGIDLVMAQTDYAVPVAIHRASSSNGTNDPYHYAAAQPLLSLIGLQGYPDARINRLTSWNYPEPNNVNQVLSYTQGQGSSVKVGLAMKATVAGGNINLDVKAKFGTSLSGAKLVVYVLENGLIYNQTNYTSYYGGGSVIQNFTHNHVLRATFTNILGDEIPAGDSAYGTTYSKSFSVAVPSNVANSANIEFVAFIVGADKKAINVRKAVNGDDQSLEIIE